MNENLYEILQACFPENPDAVCLILPDGSKISYGSLQRESSKYAGLLVSLGVKPGDRVAVQVGKSAQALFLYLGSLRAGAVYLPMNDAYQRHEVGYFLEDAAPRVFVCKPQVRAQADELAEKAGVRFVFELDDNGKGSLAKRAAALSDCFDTVPCRGNDLAALLYTSGTTGRPKAAMLSHGNLVSNVKVLYNFWGFHKGDVLLHMLPIFHVHGLFVAMHCALMNGSPIYFEPRFDVGRALDLLPTSTVFMGVPTYYVRLLADPGLTREICSNMRLFVSGSAPLSAETFDIFRERTGHCILERYGMTEGNIFSSNPLVGERRSGTVGFPLPGVSIRIADDHDHEVSPDEIGHIQVKGDNIFQGYWQKPEKTEESFTADGYFKTGDIGKRDKDGYIALVGRSNDLIITGGLNVYPKEIEDVMDSIPGILESAVFGIPHPDFGEAVAAAVVLDRQWKGSALTEAGVIGSLKNVLANFKVPKCIHFIDEIPRNLMGKIEKKLLRQRFG